MVTDFERRRISQAEPLVGEAVQLLGYSPGDLFDLVSLPVDGGS